MITTVLALAAAYLLNSSSLRNKNLYVIALTLGMLVPTISVGLGLRILFGTNGFIDLLTGAEIEIRGFPGLIMGSVMTSFPATFLILYDALHYEDKGPYDAASIMGIPRLSTFFRLTIPYLRIALISAFFACFTLIFSDYGMPMEIAGGSQRQHCGDHRGCRCVNKGILYRFPKDVIIQNILPVCSAYVERQRY